VQRGARSQARGAASAHERHRPRLRRRSAHRRRRPRPHPIELERRFLRVIRRLPKPLVNAPLGPYNVDFLWPSHRLVVEVDGARFHDHPIARRRDHARDTDLQLRGYLVTRLTWHEITQEPALVRDRVARLLSDRASRTGS
jgi:very-short-patch-repair endonuclease